MLEIYETKGMGTVVYCKLEGKATRANLHYDLSYVNLIQPSQKSKTTAVTTPKQTQ